MIRVFVVFLLFFSFSFGGVLKSLEEKLKEVSSIKADFKQRTYMPDLEQPEEFEGKIFISKNQQIKIIYEKPIKQIYFLDKNELTIYTPEDKQVVKSSLTDQFFLLKIFKAFMSEEGLSSLFKVETEKRKGDLIDIVLSVKGKSDIKKTEMILKKDLTVKQIIVWDKEGNRMEINFYDFVYSKEPVELYIKIPEDVEIIYY
ncbi:Outer membrane lipoprotein-sorting protein [Persephonella hydrogeniphila]|uniref:Outer membrane lipoprotein-sorting protein n=1 Tax=Persephonella hydrogeniphila TaxID=198703 RepID=A0A285NL58_9AQUI|nr:outer membrane lipoprotein carrier protein LolA [Persephonella hydrogeniphila]SNZ08606.1 Outer membrane lipoprotein-sorting protein [Persephonella hydrogeniphila]